MAQYTQEFQNFLRDIPKFSYPSIESYIEAEVKPHNLFPLSRMYEPIVLPVRTTKTRGNFVGVRITPWRQGWWEVAQKGVAAMMGIADARKVDLRDIYGNSLKTMDIGSLASLEEAEVYDGEDRVLVVNAPVPHASIHPLKEHMLEEWWQHTESELGNIAAQVLKGSKTTQEISSKLAMEDDSQGVASGKLEQTLRSHLAQTIDAEFVRTFAEDDEVAAVSPSDVVKDVARLAMASIRSSMRNSLAEVEKCMANHMSEDDLFAIGEKSNSPYGPAKFATDEFGTYRKIAAHGIRRGDVRGNSFIILRHGNPYRHHKHRHHPHHGHHHHMHGHTHKVRVAVVDKPVSVKPYGQPVRDMPMWWYGEKTHEFFTSGAGAHQTESSPLKSEGLYRGDYAQAVREYHLFAGRAPAPTPSFLQQIKVGAQAESPELIDANFFTNLRAKYRKNRLKNAKKRLASAQEAGNERRINFWTKRVEYWEGKTAKDADVDTLISEAIGEEMEFGEEPIEAMAHATWLIGCDACKSRDSAYYERKVRKWRSRLEDARRRNDTEGMRHAEDMLATYESNYQMAYQYPAVGNDMDDAYHRLLAVEEAIIHGANDFFDESEPTLVGAELTVGERVVDTMLKYLYKFADAEGPDAAVYLARELREEAPDKVAETMWNRVLAIAEPELEGNGVSAETRARKYTPKLGVDAFEIDAKDKESRFKRLKNWTKRKNDRAKKRFRKIVDKQKKRSQKNIARMKRNHKLVRPFVPQAAPLDPLFASDEMHATAVGAHASMSRPALEDELAYYDMEARRAHEEGNEMAAKRAALRAQELRARLARPPTTPQIGEDAMPRLVPDDELEPVISSPYEFRPRGETPAVKVGDRVIHLVDRSNPNRVTDTARGLLSAQERGGKPARVVAERRMKAAADKGDVAGEKFYRDVMEEMPVSAPVPTPSTIKLVDRAPKTRTVRVEEKDTTPASISSSKPLTFAELMRMKQQGKI